MAAKHVWHRYAMLGNGVNPIYFVGSLEKENADLMEKENASPGVRVRLGSPQPVMRQPGVALFSVHRQEFASTGHGG